MAAIQRSFSNTWAQQCPQSGPSGAPTPSCIVSRQRARTARIYGSPNTADSLTKPELNCTILVLFIALPPLSQAVIFLKMWPLVTETEDHLRNSLAITSSFLPTTLLPQLWDFVNYLEIHHLGNSIRKEYDIQIYGCI